MGFLSQHKMLIAAGAAVFAGVTVAVVVLLKMPKRIWRWLAWLALAILIVAGLIFLRDPDPRESGLPSVFLHRFWYWVLAFGLATFFAARALMRLIRGHRDSATLGAGEGGGQFPDIDAAWDEILLRLDQAKIDLGRQHVYLLIAPEEDWSAALIRSAGLQLFIEAPEAPGPIHAYATAEGVLLTCAGASALGLRDGGTGIARLEHLCRLLQTRQPDCPVVRGVAVLFPIVWAGMPDAVTLSASVRDDLQAIQRTLKVRCPVFALFPQMETVPGFTEFIGRMPVELRNNRCGFAVPGNYEFSGDLIGRGMVWMSGWFHNWSMNLIAGDLFNHAGNNRIYQLGQEFRRYRKRFRNLLETAFATHREAEPVLFRGTYFMATGDGPDESGFSAGLFRGPRARVLADHVATRWTREALDEDQRYRRIALGVGIVGGLLALLAWGLILLILPSIWVWCALVFVLLVWIALAVKFSNW